MVNVLRLAAAALLPALPSVVLGGDLVVDNQCAFEIYCFGTASPGDGNPAETGPTVAVPAGTFYTSPYPAQDNNVGVNLKCGATAALPSPYILEVTVDQGVSYVDLSAIAGDAFVGYTRSAEVVGSSCGTLDCAPGATGCEYPTLLVCASTANVRMTLC
ncbi:hypothetical protein GGR56DRAFT_674104 [Xylariaceae sp. FL0804]|nr:hypothetical protein GGR56DRAFT_674104 [Xylariaceae sp. FL0804]